MTQNVATLSCGAVGVWGYNKRVILRNCTMDGNRAPQTSAFYVTSADSIELRRSRTARDMLMVLDGCYRNGCKYWETIYMLRKLVISVVYVLNSYSQWTLSVMRTIIITSLTSHLMLRPFKTQAGQALETVCLLSLTLLSTLDTTEQKSGRTVYIEMVLVVIPLLFSAALAMRKLAVKLLTLLKSKRKKKAERARLLQSEDE
ncbi:hypothetical protein PROFUN_04123 [Planoprotostelium fungivorum]|uniref:Uncharacterized protein n=1 Tax=Planoprotostelium fungivorum TaxID=1890364 RepID=A0A2P6NJM1_9EUKA|nr:hypothetical protein PROFUN_04123 [Planoprotostelium fungivorum]